MSFSDLLGLGKILPLDKLVEVISKMTGRLTKQYFDKKDIQTKAYEIEMLAEADAVKMKILSDAVKKNFAGTGGIEYRENQIQIASPPEISLLPSAELKDRTQERLLFQGAKKQLNIESITEIAAEQLKNEPEIDNQPVDEDWMNRFFNIAEDISNEEMQALWGKILAGEIKRPKSYSLRTLEIIRNMNKDEADVITKIANYTIRVGNDYAIYKGNDNELSKYGISFYDTSLMVELGILQPGDFMTYIFYKSANSGNAHIIYGNYFLKIELPPIPNDVHLPIYLFTKSGIEILKLLSINPSLDYLRDVAKIFQFPGSSIKYASITEYVGDSIKYTNMMELYLK
jgi:hypothetical protein